MNFMRKFEKRFGKYAIKNLTVILIACYVAGFIIERFAPNFMNYLTLDPYAIAHGQVWRIVSWLLIPPPESNLFFAIIMCLFYLSIGTTLERTWGAFQYNLYIFSGFIFTVLGSFLMMAYCSILKPGLVELYGNGELYSTVSYAFSTYYVNMSIFLAYAMTFPDNQVLLMFIIPIKVKWMGVAYGGFLIYEMIMGMVNNPVLGFVFPFVIGSSLFNFIIFFFTTRRYMKKGYHRNRKQKSFNSAYGRAYEQTTRVGRHYCAVCGKTDKDYPNMQFRFCSKCNGNYEFCEEHIFTHVHITENNKGNPKQNS